MPGSVEEPGNWHRMDWAILGQECEGQARAFALREVSGDMEERGQRVNMTPLIDFAPWYCKAWRYSDAG